MSELEGNVDVSNSTSAAVESAPVVAVESNAPVESATETPSEQESTQEKMIPQSQVNRIAAKEARAAADRARKELMAEMQQQHAAQQAQQSQQGNQGADQNLQNATPEQIREHIKHVAHQMSVESVAQKMASDFEAKMESKMDADPEFEKKYKSLKIENHPELILWTNSLDNTADVISDIAENPGKMAQILMLAKSGLGYLAQQELTKLSNSIKTNKEAQKQPSANEPLSSLKPSNIGTVDDAKMSVNDFRKIFKG